MANYDDMSNEELLALYQQMKGGKAVKTPDTIYKETMAREQAKADIGRLEAAGEGARSGYANEATAQRAEALLPRTPVGPFAEQRIGLGKTLPALSFLPGIPNKEQTANLEEFRNIASQGSLGDVSKLKGPLSEKELAFIQKLQVDPGASREGNKRVIEAQKWLAKRQTAYDSALRKWTETLGAPSRANANGLTFDQWWGRYSAMALPPPGVRAPTAPKASPKPGQKAAYTILAVED